MNKTLFIGYLFFLTLGLSTAAVAQSASDQSPKPIKILFIGNSFLYNNNLPDLENSMAEAAHIKVQIDSRIALGQSINYHYHDKACWTKIKEKKWDYIVIQDNQRHYYDTRGMIDSFDYKNLKTMRSPLLENNIRFQDSIKMLIPGVKIIYFAGWEQGRGDQIRFPDDSAKGLIKRILVNYKYMNDLPGVHNIIAPIGVAFIKCLDERPYMGVIPKPSDTAKYLFDHDGRHPGNAGTYVAACVLFATIFRQTPVGVTNTNKDVTLEMDTFIKKIAWESVMDSFDYTNLASITPLIRRSKKNENEYYTSKNYDAYQWYIDDNPVPGATSYKYVPAPDIHQSECWIETMDKKGFQYRSFPFMIK